MQLGNPAGYRPTKEFNDFIKNEMSQIDSKYPDIVKTFPEYHFRISSEFRIKWHKPLWNGFDLKSRIKFLNAVIKSLS